MSDRGLTHIDPLGRARMVDVTPKEATHRRAIARCKVFMKAETTSKVASNAMSKGDVLGAARIAGIQVAKRTSDLIPLCHPLLVGAVAINFTIGDEFVEVEAQVETVDRTGVEMEAMTACAIASLTIYDMCKSADRSMVIGELALWEKTGGRSGVWRRPAGSLAEPLVNTPPSLQSADGFETTTGSLSPSALEARIDGLLDEARAEPDDLL
jgi:cyclic pyranopterin phosphate synthase